MAGILGIETSCDETAAAVALDGGRIVSSVVASQISSHAAYGGVIPELAAREHLKAIGAVVETALREAKTRLNELDAVAVTNLPGLVPALLVGVNFAKGLSAGSGLPLIGVNHFFAHIVGAFLDGAPGALDDNASYPLLALVVSGGHTALLQVDAKRQARIIGRTLDDAAGEAFDKAAKMLGVGYPGGPVVERLAAEGHPAAIAFPRALAGRAGKPVSDQDRRNFSFSGLKTSLLYHLRGLGREPDERELRDIAASYQAALVDSLATKTLAAAADFAAKTLVVCGGVACNGALRQRLADECPETTRLVLAPKKYCSDNAAMVAALAWRQFRRGDTADLSLDVQARLPEISSTPF